MDAAEYQRVPARSERIFWYEQITAALSMHRASAYFRMQAALLYFLQAAPHRGSILRESIL